LLSGVSGHGARSFYYPEVAQQNCNECHMPSMASSDLGSRYLEKLKGLGVHSHAFPSANTALAHWMGDKESVERHRKYLQGTLQIDLFGLREGGSIDGKLQSPLGDQATVQAGETYLLETVLRTMTLGHHFTQGTTDSNQIWIEMTAKQGDEIIAKSGHRDEREKVDEWSHFVNNFILDRNGERINRRNAQDIFTPLYNHQIPPGAGQTVHYRLEIPSANTQPILVTARLLYRKFDTEYLDYIRRDRDPAVDPLSLGNPGEPNDLPIVEIASDTIQLNIEDGTDKSVVDQSGGEDVTSDVSGTMSEKKVVVDPRPLWQRWNDYGIGMLLKGKAELRQAAEAFSEVEKLGRYDGPLNLARVQFAEGDLDAATESLKRAATMEPPPPTWTHSWLSGMVNRQQGNLRSAADSFTAVLETRVPDRGFDFSLDYVVRNELGLTLIDLAQQADVQGSESEYRSYLNQAKLEFEAVLQADSENVTAHANLVEIYSLLGDEKLESLHRELHTRYKPDDNAAEVAVPAARRRYPAANHAAEALVIYDLQRDDTLD
ncbi:MAG: tetratricopeptide repeat protein, partial [Rubripirellula sp.]